MKHFFSLFGVECKRMLTSCTFYVSIAIFAVLYLLSCLNFRDSSVIYELQHVLSDGTFRELCTVCMVLPYGLSYYQEKKNQNMQLIVSRSGRRSYGTSKVLSCFLSGGMVALLGLILFIFILHNLVGLPWTDSTMGDDVYYMDILLAKKQYMEFWIAQGMTHFLYGGTTAVLGLLISVVIANPFVAAMGPYMVLYMVRIIACTRLPVELDVTCVATGDIRFSSFVSGMSYIIVFFLVYLLLEYVAVYRMFWKE